MENKVSSDELLATSLEREKHLDKPLKRDTEQEFQDALVTVPPDGGWGWMVVFGAFTTFLIIDGILYSFGVFLDKLSEDLMCSKTQVSMTAAIITGVFCFSGPFTASLVNNFGYRIVAVTGSVISIISCLVTSISKSIYLIYFTYGIMAGIGFGMVYMPAVIAVGFYFEKWRGIATGISTCGAGLGGVAIPIIITLALERLDWRQTFRYISAMLIVTTICAMTFRPITPTRIRGVRMNAVDTGNFFTTYHNKMYPTLSEITEVPTMTLIQPKILNKSSELMVMTYPSTSMKYKIRDDETTGESFIPSQTIMETDKTKDELEGKYDQKLETLFVSKRHKRQVPYRHTYLYFGSYMRPLYRDDIFYDSSFNFLQKYKRSEKKSSQWSGAAGFSKSNMEYHMSVTRMATSRDIHGTGKFTICTDAVKRTLATMLDYRLLKSPSFLLMAINSTFVCLGYFTTYIFIKDRAVQIGVPKETTFWLISIIGASNTIGRVCCGVIASFSRVDYTLLCSSYLLIGGIATILSVHFDQVIAQVCYAVVFGSFVACVSALRTLIIVETLGLETLTNAVGLTLLFQGAAAVIGVCIAGLLRAATGDYKWSFYFSGTSIIIGALCILPLKRIAKWENFEKKARKQAKINEADMI